jgi:hypothetical protein
MLLRIQVNMSLNGYIFIEHPCTSVVQQYMCVCESNGNHHARIICSTQRTGEVQRLGENMYSHGLIDNTRKRGV